MLPFVPRRTAQQIGRARHQGQRSALPLVAELAPQAKSARGAERSYFAAAEGIRDFNLRLMEMAQTNTMAALDFARELSTAKNPPEAGRRLYT